MSARRGHRSVPHPADARIEAWAPEREACLAEAATALVESFAVVIAVAAERTMVAGLDADTGEDVLFVLLGDIVFLLDAEDVVPVEIEVRYGRWSGSPHVGLAQERGGVRRRDSESGRPARSALHRHREAWWCAATIDV
ncbi:archease [Amycolatopsis anabasis]|uniref:archease n=1 Tax=Amycolatopsis anabasis TaxID=1840409 RepID=UPI00131DBE93|nr:archease [Amycolatopsis anabasis]